MTKAICLHIVLALIAVAIWLPHEYGVYKVVAMVAALVVAIYASLHATQNR